MFFELSKPRGRHRALIVVFALQKLNLLVFQSLVPAELHRFALHLVLETLVLLSKRSDLSLKSRRLSFLFLLKLFKLLALARQVSLELLKRQIDRDDCLLLRRQGESLRLQFLLKFADLLEM